MNTERNDSFIGLPHKEVRRLLDEACAEIEGSADMLFRMERYGRTLDEAFCYRLELLLLSRIDLCRKLFEYYQYMERRRVWFMRTAIRKRIASVTRLHRESLSQLMLLRNYVVLHFRDRSCD